MINTGYKPMDFVVKLFLAFVVGMLLILSVAGCKMLTPEHQAGIVIAHDAMDVLLPACVGDPNDPNDGDRRACEEGLRKAAIILDELNTLVEMK